MPLSVKNWSKRVYVDTLSLAPLESYVIFEWPLISSSFTNITCHFINPFYFWCRVNWVRIISNFNTCFLLSNRPGLRKPKPESAPNRQNSEHLTIPMLLKICPSPHRSRDFQHWATNICNSLGTKTYIFYLKLHFFFIIKCSQ